MVSTLTWNARDVGLIPALGAIFSIFITPMTYINDFQCTLIIFGGINNLSYLFLFYYTV